jgi:hypothetical protein
MLEASHNNELPPIPGKRYFTIGGARQKMSGEDAREDITQSQQIVHQIRIELEDVLQLLKR